jgi:hypothetical protein
MYILGHGHKFNKGCAFSPFRDSNERTNHLINFVHVITQQSFVIL